MKKCLIAIDGLDASGKKTQTELLAAAFAAKGIPCRCISFPTYDSGSSALVNMYLGGRFGEDPQAVNPYAASTFFGADRYCSYMLDWKKDYDAGTVILANRYTSANAVHQLSKMPRRHYAQFLEWLTDNEYNRLGIPRPDAVVYLCLPPEQSMRLLEKRCAETGAQKDIHEKSKGHLENSYRAALYSAKKLGWMKIDCDRDGEIRTVEDIQNEIIERLRAGLPGLGL
ncbi:MAG: deoxynucleoside kinase [Clostridia bacterium]|nr:deoxynucleoside kinase [Clostridia bacterium]MBR5746980.1 deoxynucleoside kinase [Clostridia bacterium]